MKRGGHYAISLVFALPVVVFARGWYGVVLYLAILTSTMVPNKETGLGVLNRRGIGHTVWFGVGCSIVIASVVTALVVGLNNGVMRFSSLIPDVVNGVYLWVVVVVGCLIGTMSHLLADVLSGGSSNRAVKPLWPVVRRRMRIGVFEFDSPVINHGLLRFMVVVHIITIFIVVF